VFSFTIAPTFESYFIGVPTSGFLTSGLVTSAAVADPPPKAPNPMAPKTIGKPPLFAIVETTFP